MLDQLADHLHAFFSPGVTVKGFDLHFKRMSYENREMVKDITKENKLPYKKWYEWGKNQERF